MVRQVVALEEEFQLLSRAERDDLRYPHVHVEEGVEIEQRTINGIPTDAGPEVVDDPQGLVDIRAPHRMREAGRFVVLALVVAVDVEARFGAHRVAAQHPEDAAQLDVPGKDCRTGDGEVVTVVEVAVPLFLARSAHEVPHRPRIPLVVAHPVPVAP